MKQAAQRKPAARDLLWQLERSYRDRIGHWKHGGIVGVKGYGGGVIGRYSDLPEEFPNVAEFHTFRVNQPTGWFYTTRLPPLAIFCPQEYNTLWLLGHVLSKLRSVAE